MTLISYAQAYEDVLLHRALHHVHHSDGFYIDVGACDPHFDSVTKHFYNHGWRGVNVEPSKRGIDMFNQQRLRDINLQAAVSDVPGSLTFHELDNGQLSTMVAEFAARHQDRDGYGVRSYNVPAMTLTQICEQHAPEQIHFLKIDVEGYEGNAIRGMDFQRFRPWVLVIEATEPMRLDKPTYAEWDQSVQQSGYHFAYTDVLNRYYVSYEQEGLRRFFDLPADDFVRAHYVSRVEQLERELIAVKNAGADT